MPEGIGYQFAPSAGDINMQNGGGQGGGSAAGGLTPQQAIRILSLRIPNRSNGRGIAPNALLQGGGAATPGFNVGGFDAVIQALMGAFSPQPGSGGGQVTSAGLPPFQPPAPQQGGGGMPPPAKPSTQPPPPKIKPGQEAPPTTNKPSSVPPAPPMSFDDGPLIPLI